MDQLTRYMSKPKKGDRVYIDASFPDVSVTASDPDGFDWEEDHDDAKHSGSGGWQPFIDSEGQSNWRILKRLDPPEGAT